MPSEGIDECGFARGLRSNDVDTPRMRIPASVLGHRGSFDHTVTMREMRKLSRGKNSNDEADVESRYLVTAVQETSKYRGFRIERPGTLKA